LPKVSGRSYSCLTTTSADLFSLCRHRIGLTPMIRAFLLAAITLNLVAANPVLANACKNAMGNVVKCPGKAALNKTGKAKVNVPMKTRSHVTDFGGRMSYKW
jgi:hypothetical protein